MRVNPCSLHLIRASHRYTCTLHGSDNTAALERRSHSNRYLCGEPTRRVETVETGEKEIFASGFGILPASAKSKNINYPRFFFAPLITPM